MGFDVELDGVTDELTEEAFDIIEGAVLTELLAVVLVGDIVEVVMQCNFIDLPAVVGKNELLF